MGSTSHEWICKCTYQLPPPTGTAEFSIQALSYTFSTLSLSLSLSLSLPPFSLSVSPRLFFSFSFHVLSSQQVPPTNHASRIWCAGSNEQVHEQVTDISIFSYRLITCCGSLEPFHSGCMLISSLSFSFAGKGAVHDDAICCAVEAPSLQSVTGTLGNPRGRRGCSTHDL